LGLGGKGLKENRNLLNMVLLNIGCVGDFSFIEYLDKYLMNSQNLTGNG
jgi:hypothetical protein